MAYVGIHRALRPLPLRHPAITSAGVAAVIGIFVSAAALATSGPAPVRTQIADAPPLTTTVTGAVPTGQPPATGNTLPDNGSPQLTPVVQESPASTRTHTTSRTRHADETLTKNSARDSRGTQTVTTTRSTRTSSKSSVRTTPPNRTVTHQPVVTTTTTTTTTTTQAPVGQGALPGGP